MLTGGGFGGFAGGGHTPATSVPGSLRSSLDLPRSPLAPMIGGAGGGRSSGEGRGQTAEPAGPVAGAAATADADAARAALSALLARGGSGAVDISSLVEAAGLSMAPLQGLPGGGGSGSGGDVSMSAVLAAVLQQQAAAAAGMGSGMDDASDSAAVAMASGLEPTMAATVLNVRIGCCLLCCTCFDVCHCALDSHPHILTRSCLGSTGSAGRERRRAELQRPTGAGAGGQWCRRQ